MKTNLYTLAKALMLAAMTLVLANCSKDSNNNSPYATQYQWANGGICVDTRNSNMQVPTNYCSATNTQYQWVNGTCYDTINRVTAPNVTLCQQYGSNVCNGTYYYNLGYGAQAISCNSSSTNYYTNTYQSGYNVVYNCRGLSLYQLVNNSYQQVTCQ